MREAYRKIRTATPTYNTTSANGTYSFSFGNGSVFRGFGIELILQGNVTDNTSADVSEGGLLEAITQITLDNGGRAIFQPQMDGWNLAGLIRAKNGIGPENDTPSTSNGAYELRMVMYYPFGDSRSGVGSGQTDKLVAPTSLSTYSAGAELQITLGAWNLIYDTVPDGWTVTSCELSVFTDQLNEGSIAEEGATNYTVPNRVMSEDRTLSTAASVDYSINNQPYENLESFNLIFDPDSGAGIHDNIGDVELRVGSKVIDRTTGPMVKQDMQAKSSTPTADRHEGIYRISKNPDSRYLGLCSIHEKDPHVIVTHSSGTQNFKTHWVLTHDDALRFADNVRS